MSGKHKNQVGQTGVRNSNGGEWARKVPTEANDGVLTAPEDERTGGDLLHVEYTLPRIAYAEMPHTQRKQATAIAARVVSAQGMFRKPVKTYEPTPLDNGNTAVYINIAYGDAPFDEVFNRVELTPEGDVVRHDAAYMQGGTWRRISSDEDLRRFLDDTRVGPPRTHQA